MATFHGSTFGWFFSCVTRVQQSHEFKRKFKKWNPIEMNFRFIPWDSSLFLAYSICFFFYSIFVVVVRESHMQNVLTLIYSSHSCFMYATYIFNLHLLLFARTETSSTSEIFQNFWFFFVSVVYIQNTRNNISHLLTIGKCNLSCGDRIVCASMSTCICLSFVESTFMPYLRWISYFFLFFFLLYFCENNVNAYDCIARCRHVAMYEHILSIHNPHEEMKQEIITWERARERERTKNGGNKLRE